MDQSENSISPVSNIQESTINNNNIQLQSQNSIRIDEMDPSHVSTTMEIDDADRHHQSLHTPATGEQQLTAFDYFRQQLENITAIVNESKSILEKLVISNIVNDSYLNIPQSSSYEHLPVAAQQPLKNLMNIFQRATGMPALFQIRHNTNDSNNVVQVGEELHEISEKNIAQPSEQNGSQLNRDIQADVFFISTKSVNSKEVCQTNSLLSLSQLLSKAETHLREIKLTTVNIFEQPNPYWKKRTINCLMKKWCPAIQGNSGKQRHYIGIEWSKFSNSISNNLFVLVQLLSYDNQTNSSKILIPPETTVKNSKVHGKKQSQNRRRQRIDDLVIKDTYGFNRRTNTILCPVDKDEFSQCRKNLKVIMLSLYTKSEDACDSKDSDECNDSSTDADETSDFQLESRKLCKLSICLCQRTSDDNLERISNFIVTDWIEESKGNKPLAIDATSVTPKSLCKCGNEIITVQLNTDSERNGFIVCLNDKKLSLSQIRGVKDERICFKSRPYSEIQDETLNVKVSKKSFLETIKHNRDPNDGLFEKLLLDLSICYTDHSTNPHDHQNTYDETSESVN